jgi:hypothetical protein
MTQLYDDKFAPPMDMSVNDSTPLSRLMEFVPSIQTPETYHGSHQMNVPTASNADVIHPPSFTFKDIVSPRQKVLQDYKEILMILVLFLLFNYRKLLDIIVPLLPNFDNTFTSIMIQGLLMSVGGVMLKKALFV